MGRPVVNGSGAPPLYSDPSAEPIESVLNGFEETPPGRLSDNFRLRLPSGFLFATDDQLSDSGMRALQTIASAVSRLPYDILLQVDDPSRLPMAARVQQYFFTVAGIHPGRIGIGIGPVRSSDQAIWLVLLRNR